MTPITIKTFKHFTVNRGGAGECILPVVSGLHLAEALHKCFIICPKHPLTDLQDIFQHHGENKRHNRADCGWPPRSIWHSRLGYRGV